MKTVTIQIGNTDKKLTQHQWAEYVKEIEETILLYCLEQHFFGTSTYWEKWQNAAWVVDVREDNIEPLKSDLLLIMEFNGQEAIAWTEGKTELLH